MSHDSTQPTRKQTIHVNVKSRSNRGHSKQQGHKVMQSTNDNIARFSREIFGRVCWSTICQSNITSATHTPAIMTILHLSCHHSMTSAGPIHILSRNDYPCQKSSCVAEILQCLVTISTLQRTARQVQTTSSLLCCFLACTSVYYQLLPSMDRGRWKKLIKTGR